MSGNDSCTYSHLLVFSFFLSVCACMSAWKLRLKDDVTRTCLAMSVRVRQAAFVYLRVFGWGGQKKPKKNTSGDETDTFPDGSTNITLTDIAHTLTLTHAHAHTHQCIPSDWLGEGRTWALTLKERKTSCTIFSRRQSLGFTLCQKQ